LGFTLTPLKATNMPMASKGILLAMSELTGCGLRNIPQTVRENAHDLSAYARKNHEGKAGAMGHVPCSRSSRSSPVSSRTDKCFALQNMENHPNEHCA
jgi:hypothetical protein